MTYLQPSVLTLLLVASSCVFASESDPLEVTVIKHQISQLPNIGKSLTVITQEDIIKSGASSVAQAISKSGHATITQNYSGTATGGVVTLRGFGENSSANILVLINGQPLNNPTLEAPNLDIIDIDEIKRIEIFDGSDSVYSGPGAVGGVINIVLEENRELKSSLKTETNDRGGNNVTFKSTTTIAPRNFLSATFLKGETRGYRDHSDGDDKQIVLAISGFNERLRYTIEQGFTNNYRENPGPLTAGELASDRFQVSPIYANDYSEQINRNTRINLSREFSRSKSLDLQFSHRDSDEKGYFFGPYIDSTRVSRLRAALSNDSVTEPHDWQAGTELTYSGFDSTNSLGITDSNQKQQAIFASSAHELSPKTKVSAGFRINHISEHDKIGRDSYSETEPTGQIQLTYDISSFTDVFVRLDKNVRFSNINENAYTPPGINFLSPQKSYSIELGGTYKTEKSKLSVKMYHLSLEDEIYYDGFYNSNLEGSERYGVRAHWQTKLSPKLTSALILDLKNTRTDSGKRVPYTSKISGLGSLDYALNDFWTLYTQVHYEGSRYLAGDNDNSLAQLNATTLVNSGLSYSRDQIIFTLSLDNLFDQEHLAFAGTYGSPDFNYYYPGASRTLKASLRYTF